MDSASAVGYVASGLNVVVRLLGSPSFSGGKGIPAAPKPNEATPGDGAKYAVCGIAPVNPCTANGPK